MPKTADKPPENMKNFGETVEGVEIMRSGTHTASSGMKVTFDDEDLERIAHAYDTSIHEAPVVVGHPDTNGPAYGWVKALRLDGSRLLADMDLHDAFAPLLRDGIYKKRSASIYKDLDGKGLYLRHVGFLGAAPPAMLIRRIQQNPGSATPPEPQGAGCHRHQHAM